MKEKAEQAYAPEGRKPSVTTQISQPIGSQSSSSKRLNFSESEMNQEGRTIVMVTHDMRAAGTARRTLRLVNGTILNDTGAMKADAFEVDSAQQVARL